MAELTVLRVEVTNAGTGNSDSLKSGKAKSGKGLGVSNKSLANHNETAVDAVSNNSSNLSRKERLMAKKGQHQVLKKESAVGKFTSGLSSLQKGAGIAAAGAQIVNQGYQMYSNYKIAGHEMSGATHAAAVQGRKGSMISTGADGVALIALVATGPVGMAAAAVIIAKKAWTLAQTNMKEIFAIEKDQILSEVLQRNLVKTVAERRF